MEHYTQKLVPDGTYHVYNRANGSEKIFLSGENYKYFLKKYLEYISPVADTFCYCLMPNHFHFVIRVKSEQELINFILLKNTTHRELKTHEGLTDHAKLIKFVHLQFSHFFNGYVQAFNKQQKRIGSLFIRTFKRKRVNTSNYLLNLIKYIHLNPINLTKNYKIDEYKYSSYNHIISDKETFILKDEVLNLFGDKFNFIAFHQNQHSKEDIKRLELDSF